MHSLSFQIYLIYDLNFQNACQNYTNYRHFMKVIIIMLTIL